MSARDYLSIGEVLSLLQEEFPDVTISKIRFLEGQGLIDPERTPSGYRKFKDPDIERLRFILREQREHYLPLKVIKDRLEDGDGDDDEVVLIDGVVAIAPEGPFPDTSAPPATVLLAPTADTPAVAGSVGGAATPVAGELSKAALAEACELTVEELTEVERYGLVTGRSDGKVTLYDADTVAVGRVVAAFMRHGIEPRHLRMYRQIAEREAALFEQVILPFAMQRNPAGRAQAHVLAEELTELGTQLRQSMLDHELRRYRDG